MEYIEYDDAALQTSNRIILQRTRKGYASAVVASLSSLAPENGKQFCTLYTDLSNPTSNSIYQKIGYEFVAEVMDVNFERKG